jgi:hypothetical protein
MANGMLSGCGSREWRLRATLRHWLDRYEDRELIDAMNYVLGDEEEKRAREEGLQMLLPQTDVRKLISKYPLLLGNVPYKKLCPTA